MICLLEFRTWALLRLSCVHRKNDLVTFPCILFYVGGGVCYLFGCNLPTLGWTLLGGGIPQ
jgi:hypothetical protein